MDRKTGGFAFPVSLPVSQIADDPRQRGMTLRDWFAGQALAGFCSVDSGTPESDASNAYAIAEAMLEARNG